MIVYVESNFVLELAYLQEEHESCEQIPALAEGGNIELALPAYCVGEPYESWVRRAKRRKELYELLARELGELARSQPYVKSPNEFQELTGTLIRSVEEEKQRLDDAISRILETTTVIPILPDTIKRAISLQKTRDLSPQDSIVYASVLTHLSAAVAGPKCFITKNVKDFANPDVDQDLGTHNCKLLTKFEHGLGYAQSQLAST
jgi:predicted nucleic acid-binding protein